MESGVHVGVTPRRDSCAQIGGSVDRSDCVYWIWCNKPLEMGLFKKFGAPVRPAVLNGRHGLDHASGIPDRVSAPYGHAVQQLVLP